MEYAAITFWLSVIVFTALGVHRLWSALIKPKAVNTILLPGTLVATLGHILGLLITGGTVEDTALIKDDDSGEPQTGKDPKPKVPIIGAVVVALLPMIGCAVAIYGVSHYFGSPVLQALNQGEPQRLVLPTAWPMFFDMLRQAVTLVEKLVRVVLDSNLQDWHILLFLYLSICLTVRMAPLTGNIRGAIGAILIAGVLAYLIARMSPPSPDSLQSTWLLITYSVAVLLLLLIISLLVTGAVHLVRTFVNSK
jgi:hypothetical protein